MKLTMKTTFVLAALASTSTVTINAYNPNHLGRLGSTPQPNFMNPYQKPKKRGLTPWVSLKQIREGNSISNHPMEGQPYPPPPMHHPFGMPLPFGGTGIPIAPDPNPNDFNEFANPAWPGYMDDDQIDDFRHHLFQDRNMHPGMHMHPGMDGMEPPHGFNDFSNEDAWAWKREHDMPHPGPPPPGMQMDHRNNMFSGNQDNHVRHPIQGLTGGDNNMNSTPLEPPVTAGGAPKDPSLEALERMFRMKAYDKDAQQPKSSPSKPQSFMDEIPTFDINDLPGFGGGHPLRPDMDGPVQNPGRVQWKDEYKFDPTRYRNFDDTIVNNYDERHFNPSDYPTGNHFSQQQSSPQAPTPNRRLVRYRPNRNKGNNNPSARARTDLGAQPNHFGGGAYGGPPQDEAYRPMQDPNHHHRNQQRFERPIRGHHQPPPNYRPMEDPNQSFGAAPQQEFFHDYHPQQQFIDGPEYYDPTYFDPPPPFYHHYQQEQQPLYPNFDYDGYYNNHNGNQNNGDFDGGLLFY